MNNNIYTIREIIEELYDEFLKERIRLNDICDANIVKIDEIDHKIVTLRKNEDVDFRVFSPRNVSPVNSEKIVELEKEKDELERESKNSAKQLKYYSERTDKLDKVLLLLNDLMEISVNKTLDSDTTITDDSDSNNNNEGDVFDELFPAYKKTDINSSDILKAESEQVITSNETDINNDNDDNDEINSAVEKDPVANFVSKNSLARIIHKAEFTEKIMANDSIRARLELKEIIKQLNELL